MMEPQNNKIRELLWGLGKATMRGVRKCHACGTYNGTRGTSCKNKMCNVVFRHRQQPSQKLQPSHLDEKSRYRSTKPRNLDAVQVLTGSSDRRRRLFSIRTGDGGSDLRGFVELKTDDTVGDVGNSDGTSSAEALGIRRSVPAPASGVCYVDDCLCLRRPQACALMVAAGGDFSIAAGGFLTSSSDAAVDGVIVGTTPPAVGVATEGSCVHVRQAAAESSRTAAPLVPSESALDSLRLTSDVHRLALALIEASSSDGVPPLVQRVSRNVMIVRYLPDAVSPIEFVHCGIYGPPKSSSSGGVKVQPSSGNCKVVCTCSGSQPHWKSMNAVNDDQPRCVHFYLCLCAFAADEELSKEFAFCLSQEGSGVNADSWITGAMPSLLDQAENFDALLVQTQRNLDNDDAKAAVALDETESQHLQEPASKASSTRSHASLGAIYPPVRPIQRKQKNDVSDAVQDLSSANPMFVSSPLPMRASASTAVAKQPSVFRQASSNAFSTLHVPSVASADLQHILITAQALRPVAVPPVEETLTSQTFLQWLASVTERINQAMHYQFSGYPDPLVFHAPQIFFNCLELRISGGSEKKRLPNLTTSFERNDAPPVGSFSKLTWHITSLAHVQQIFDTPEVRLELTRHFFDNKDGTFSPCNAAGVVAELHSRTKKSHARTKLPELVTFLRVGKATCPNSKEGTPFIIEWIPNILPQCKIGELRIKFEYGHRRDGELEHRDLIASSGIGSIEIQAIV